MLKTPTDVPGTPVPHPARDPGRDKLDSAQTVMVTAKHCLGKVEGTVEFGAKAQGSEMTLVEPPVHDRRYSKVVHAGNPDTAYDGLHGGRLRRRAYEGVQILIDVGSLHHELIKVEEAKEIEGFGRRFIVENEVIECQLSQLGGSVGKRIVPRPTREVEVVQFELSTRRQGGHDFHEHNGRDPGACHLCDKHALHFFIIIFVVEVHPAGPSATQRVKFVGDIEATNVRRDVG